MKTRLFIGNLAGTVTKEELYQKFEALLSNHRDEAEVGEVEVRCKNENNYFGYVDIHLKNGATLPERSGSASSKMPLFLRKYVDLMNNTKWKGSLIKVQQAKESFIEKLRKEQAGRFQNSTGYNNRSQEPETVLKKEDNTEKSRNTKHANDILNQLNKSMERRSKYQERSSFKNNNEGGDCGFEVVTNDQAPSKRTKSLPKQSIEYSSSSPKKSKRSKKSAKNNSSDDSSDEDVRDGIPKFRGLLAFYPMDSLNSDLLNKESEKPQENSSTDKSEKPIIQQKVLPIVSVPGKQSIQKPINAEEKSLNKPTGSSGINFKKNKQQRSDLLRLQSLEKLKELKSQRKNMIKSSLSSVTAVPSPQLENRIEVEDVNDEQTPSPKHKKSKMDLFNDDDSDNDSGINESTFNVKKQFEGEQGLKLLELQTRWGNDDRFKIDSRFNESDNEEDEPGEVFQEKEKQLDILTDILGKPAKDIKSDIRANSKLSLSKGPSSSVILPRYDPEADDEIPDESKKATDVLEGKKSRKSKKESKTEKEPETENKVIRSTEPATFKTVSNLKALFSGAGEDDENKKEVVSLKTISTAAQPGAFSLLDAYGGGGGNDSEADDDNSPGRSTSKKSSLNASAPRNFWQSNPFKYDSSDDEEEEGKRDKVNIVIDSKKIADKSSKLTIDHGKVSFFFRKKDTRFEGLEDYFLKKDSEVSKENDNKSEDVSINSSKEKNETDPQPNVEDFSVKRQELKAIVKAKIRNTKRKDEKRTLAIKRSIRKRKRKIHQKNRFNK